MLRDKQMKELGEIVETGPDRAVDGVVRWRRIDLTRVIEEGFDVVYSERGIYRLLAELNFTHISARPQHPRQDERIIAAFKKNFATTLAAHIENLPEQTPIEIRFQDEGALVRRTARRGCGRRRARAPVNPPISAIKMPICSEPFAQNEEQAQRSCCLGQPPRQCSRISMR